MERKFIKKAGPFGTPGPSAPTRPSPAGPGAGPALPSKPPTSPPTGLGAPTPSPTPPMPSPAGTGHPGGPPGADLAPRTPPDPMAGKEQVPTDVNIDAATGHVTIKKPGVNITVAKQAKYSKENPPSKIAHLPTHAQHIWVEAFNNAFDEYDGNEERAFATAWSAVKKAGYKTKKKATHQDFIDFKHNDNEPQYGDWKEETQYSKDTHDNLFANPKNRLVPPTFTVRAKVPEFMNAQNIAYVLQTSTMLSVDVDGNTLTVNDVGSPLSLITELTSYGIEAEVIGDDLTKFDQGFEDFKLGQKVAVVGDYADVNYFYNPLVPAAQAMIVGKSGNKYLLENDQWGRFEAIEEEIEHVR